MALNLINLYEHLNRLHKVMYETDNKLLNLIKKEDMSHLRVTSLEIYRALDFYDALRNCMSTSKNLYRALKGLEYNMPVLITRDSRHEEMKPTATEILTEEDIMNFLGVA